MEDYVSPKDILPKTNEELRRLEMAVKSNFLFVNMTQEARAAVFSKMERKVFNAGDVVFNQGEAGHWFYVVDSGDFDVWVQGDGPKSISQVVHTYKGGKHMNTHPSFGEQSLMYSKPRAATVKAKSSGVLWALHRHEFQMAIRTCV